MIALFLESHPIVQIAFVVGTLVVLFLAGLLVWAFWPVDLDAADEFCADDTHPYLNSESHDGR